MAPQSPNGRSIVDICTEGRSFERNFPRDRSEQPRIRLFAAGPPSATQNFRYIIDSNAAHFAGFISGALLEVEKNVCIHTCYISTVIMNNKAVLRRASKHALWSFGHQNFL